MVREHWGQALRRASNVTQWHKGQASKAWQLSSTSGTHLVEEENHLPQDVLLLPHVHTQ